jgi:excisionase family DNA binding protein
MEYKGRIPKLSLTVRDSATATGYCENYLRLLISRGTLPAVRVGRSVRIRVVDLEKFLEQHLLGQEAQ